MPEVSGAALLTTDCTFLCQNNVTYSWLCRCRADNPPCHTATLPARQNPDAFSLPLRVLPTRRNLVWGTCEGKMACYIYVVRSRLSNYYNVDPAPLLTSIHSERKEAGWGVAGGLCGERQVIDTLCNQEFLICIKGVIVTLNTFQKHSNSYIV